MEKFYIHNTVSLGKNIIIGENTKIWNYVQIRDNVIIGKNNIIGSGVYIDVFVNTGDNVKIENNVSVFQGVEIEDGVFIGPHVCFINDKYPRAVTQECTIKRYSDWKLIKTKLKFGCSIGANSTIICGNTIGKYAMIGAGSVVTKNVPNYGLVAGNPAKLIGFVCPCGRRIEKIRNIKNSDFLCNSCKI
jgi:acetyltransferase-like isoleucine patch superfamily enzyme